MKTKTIRQKIHFATTSRNVYDALMNSKKHARFTGGKATISKKIGGKFFAFDGYTAGKNIELIIDKKIVQTWRASDWEEGHYSTVEITLVPSAKGCVLTFVQKNVPPDHYAAIQQGWIDFYWKPMKEMLENR